MCSFGVRRIGVKQQQQRRVGAGYGWWGENVRMKAVHLYLGGELHYCVNNTRSGAAVGHTTC